MRSAKRATTTLSTKGQVILPKALRDGFRWAPGAKLLVEETPTGMHISLERPFAPTRMEDVYGSLSKFGCRPREDEIPALLKAAAKRRYAGD